MRVMARDINCIVSGVGPAIFTPLGLAWLDRVVVCSQFKSGDEAKSLLNGPTRLSLVPVLSRSTDSLSLFFCANTCI